MLPTILVWNVRFTFLSIQTVDKASQVGGLAALDGQQVLLPST